MIQLSVKRNTVDILYSTFFKFSYFGRGLFNNQGMRSDSGFCKDKFQGSTYWRDSVSLELKLVIPAKE